MATSSVPSAMVCSLKFRSAVDAVECVIDLQKAMATANSELPSDRRITLRIGINIGDVVVEGRDFYGDGVEYCRRLKGLAEAGGICVHHDVYEQVMRKLDCNSTIWACSPSRTWPSRSMSTEYGRAPSLFQRATVRPRALAIAGQALDCRPAVHVD